MHRDGRHPRLHAYATLAILHMSEREGVCVCSVHLATNAACLHTTGIPLSAVTACIFRFGQTTDG